MSQYKNLKQCYLLLGGGWLLALAYFLVVTLPLVNQERELAAEVEEAVARLAAAGHGMSQTEVAGYVDQIKRDIEGFAEIGRDRGRTIHFSPEVERMLDRPFQLLDFDHQKFLVIDRIRALSRENDVALFSNWERHFPVPGTEQNPYLLWARLAVMDQLVRTAIAAGVDTIDHARISSTGQESGGEEAGQLEVPMEMRLTGDMEAIHSVIMMLPLNGEELEAVGMEEVVEPKSSFFLSRFILKKSSAEQADKVTLELVASGFLDAASR